MRRFLNAPSAQEIVFVRGATEGINLVAQSWGRRNVGPGDEIVITWLEHHANIVPWQQLCAEKGARLRVAPVDDRGQVILEEYEKLLGPAHAHRLVHPGLQRARHDHAGARDGRDGAPPRRARPGRRRAGGLAHAGRRAGARLRLLRASRATRSSRPTGIGALFGKADVLETMPPWQGGGNMIADVTFEKTTYQPPPLRFEAGTGNIADAVGLGAALDYVSALGLENVEPLRARAARLRDRAARARARASR